MPPPMRLPRVTGRRFAKRKLSMEILAPINMPAGI